MTERDYLITLYAACLQGLLARLTEEECNALGTASIYKERLVSLAWDIAKEAYGEQNK
jgi:hypothetical protein